MFVSAAAAAPANEGTASESTTSTFKRKRSGPVSSLDYKLPLSVDKKKYVIPPRRGKKAGQQQQQQQQQQQEQSESGDPHHRTRSTPETRARTGTGIPDSATTHRLTMEDLAGMGVQVDNEQRRPDTDNAEQPPNIAHKRQEKFYRTPDGTVVKEGVDRLEILKDQGFPFVQWIILLLLLGFGLYSLYKSLSGPTTARAKKGIDSGGSISNHHKQVPGKSGKFGKNRKAPPSRSSVNASNKQKKKGENTSMIANTSRTTSIEDEKVLAEIDETVVAKPQQSAAVSKKATTKKKSAAKQQQQQGKKTANSTTSKTTKPEPTTELMGTDESSVFVTTAGRQPLTTHRSDVAVADEPVSGVGDDEDGWQTVGGSAARLAEVSAVIGSGSNDETGKPETKKIKSKTKKNKSISSVPVVELVESVAVTAVEDDVAAETPIVESSATVVDTSPVMESVFSTTLEPSVEQEEVVSARFSLQDEPTTTNTMSTQDGEIKAVDDKDIHQMNGSSPDSIEDMEVEEDAVVAAAATTATPKKKIKKKKKTKQNGAALLNVGANMTLDHDDMKDAVELATTADMTDSDEAFALQLQEEEHKLAAAADDTIIPEPVHDVSSQEIVWEEVKTKKKKQPQPPSKTESQPADTTVAEVAAAAE